MKYFELTPHYIRKEKINKIDFDDRFFASLKEDYSDFSTFFNDCQDYCYTSYDEAENIDGFLYFVIKDNYSDVLFFKVLEFGNKIEEAFLKIIIKEAKANNLEQISISVFRKEQDLVTFLEKFSFNNVEIKENRTSSGFMDDELVFIKNMSDSKYPNIDIRNKKIFLIPLTSSEHEKLFPEAEKMFQISFDDVFGNNSYLNTIEKSYVFNQNIGNVNNGDILLFYSRKYRSITSVGVVDGIFTNFSNVDEINEMMYGRTYYTFNELNKIFKPNTKLLLFKDYNTLSNPIFYQDVNKIVELDYEKERELIDSVIDQ